MQSMLTQVLIFIVILLMIVLCWFCWRFGKLIWVASKLPTPTEYTPLPLVGHAHITLQSWENVTECIVDYIIKCVASGYNIACFWCGPLPLISCFSSGDIQKILNSSITVEKGDEMSFLKYALGHGLITAPNDTWKITRRHINPLFHQKNLEHLVPTFNKNSRELVSMLGEHVGTIPVNVVDFTMKTALKSVCHLIFGSDVEFNVDSQGFDDLKYVVERILDLFMKRNVRLWLRFDTIFQFFYKKELEIINRKWKNFSEEPIKKTKENNALKRSMVKTTPENDVVEKNEESGGNLNLLDVFTNLQENYPQFSEDDLKSEMITLYIAGSDTVGPAVACSLLALAQFQDIQERLYKEVMSVIGGNNDVSIQDLNRMSYLDQVYKETLRWSSTVPFIIRKTSDDLTLSTCKIPSGNSVVVCLMGLHMNPQIYPNPKQFNPDRFSLDNQVDKQRYTFLPYSGGARSCIGKTYAQYLIKIMLIHILRKFRLSTDMDIYKMKRNLKVSIVSADGYYIRLQHRD